eukprot:TRINITY_DN122435_c0_g1_i1.p1 TRINITY_DN122435_c0_g1~~TRINITY_DN122435_c0_g1_i1.p1  ORF type:complete len:637 (-),score=216.66 TRINITY_DN122435_c0_g1_i1:297-2207(-)
MAPVRRKARRGAGGAGAAAAKLKQKNAGKGGNRGDSSGSSSRSRSGSGSSDEDSSSSGSSCSDEDDPRDYKHGGYHPVTPYQLYNGRYRVLSKLGAGAFSTVWLCADEKNASADGPELVAMKVCKSKKSVTEQALDEIMLLERMQDSKEKQAHVVQMQGHFWHSGPNGRHKCVVFEVMGENLLALVKHYDYEGLPVNMVRRLAKHTLIGLEYIHSRGVIHTDIKLENVLVERHDLAEFVMEARRAHRAFMDQRKGMEGLSKNQKKRMKKKLKNAAAKEEEKEEDDADEAATAAAEPGKEGDIDEAAAKACGRPVPPVRQRDRFESLTSERVSAKLADFGNGTRADQKVTDEIQTRQYRSPEVLIGADWNETADLWSAACMFFELLTGDFLFDPRSGKEWNRDEDHLALMIELHGSYPPKEWVLSGKYSKEFFNNAGKLKHIKKLKFWLLSDVLREKYDMSKEEALEISDFLAPMLLWDPSKRQRASEAMKHPWLDKWSDEEDSSSDTEEATETAGSDDEAATEGAGKGDDQAEAPTHKFKPEERTGKGKGASSKAVKPAKETKDAEQQPAETNGVTAEAAPADASATAPEAAATAAAETPAAEDGEEDGDDEAGEDGERGNLQATKKKKNKKKNKK